MSTSEIKAGDEVYLREDPGYLGDMYHAALICKHGYGPHKVIEVDRISKNEALMCRIQGWACDVWLSARRFQMTSPESRPTAEPNFDETKGDF